MPRKRITQVFPWLLPLRRKQRLLFFYTRMRLDGSRYAAAQSPDPLPYLLFETRVPLFNRNTGFDMVYQKNKAFNLKLAARTLDGVVVRPGETFSFWRLARHADRDVSYRDGLTVLNGKLTTAPGGGMCQMSNLLFWLFLHTPLTVIERHGHRVKDFPEPPSDAPMGVDATVSEGWLDLRVKNETDASFQIGIEFTDGEIVGQLRADRDDGLAYEVTNGKPRYVRAGREVLEEVSVLRRTVSAGGARSAPELLYRNRCVIGYPLPPETQIETKG